MGEGFDNSERRTGNICVLELFVPDLFENTNFKESMARANDTKISDVYLPHVPHHMTGTC